MKKYLFYSFKRKLPLYIIVLVLFVTVALFSFANTSFFQSLYYSADEGRYYTYYAYTSGTLPLIIAFMIILFILPFFNMGYRYSLAKSDTFRQAPFKDKHLRYAEHLSSLVIVLIAFTIAFLTLFLGLLIKNFTEPEPIVNSVYYAFSDKYERIYFHYIYFLPLYFAALILGIIQYFSTYLIISRSNNFLNSLIILIAIETGLIFLYTLSMAPLNDVGVSLSLGIPMIFPIHYLYEQFDNLIVRNINDYGTMFASSNIDDITRYLYPIFSFANVIVLGTLGILAFLLEKDPSSEWANKPETKKPFQEIIYHLSFGLTGTYISYLLFASNALLNIPWFLLFYALFSALYYTLYGLLFRNFKLNTRQTLTLVFVAAGTFVMAILIKIAQMGIAVTFLNLY